VIARLRELQARTGMTSLLAALPALLRAREGDAEPETLRRARDPGLPAAARQVAARSDSSQADNLSPALYTVLAMLGFAAWTR